MTKITFAHLADLHLGGWREKTLTDLNFITFRKAIDKVIDLKVNFCLFAGDIFNNAMPPIELVQKVVIQLIRLKEANIPLYVIGGSHDYSPTGKSFLQLLETAGVFKDVAKWNITGKKSVELTFTQENKVLISGILGKKNGLDKNIYSNLTINTLSKDNFNIFMFHCTLNDIKPDFMKAVKTEVTSNFLPKGFDYYAGGHVHTYIEAKYDSGKLSYPGPLFPNNFSEMKRENPCFNYCTFDFNSRETQIKRIFINTYEKMYLEIEFEDEEPIKARDKIFDLIGKTDVVDKIVLIEISGTIEGKISEIEINKCIKELYKKGAYHVLKNTYKLTPKSLKKIIIDESKSVEDIELEIINNTLEDKDRDINTKLIQSLLKLNLEKLEGEKIYQYEERVKKSLDKILNK